MDKKIVEALKAGAIAGSLAAIFLSTPVIALIWSTAMTPESTNSNYFLMVGMIFQCLCWAPLLALPAVGLSSIAALRWSQNAISSLNDAVSVSLLTSVLAALIGTFVPVAMIDLWVYLTHSLDAMYGNSLIVGIVGLLLFAMLSFFGGLMYSVYVLNLRYVHRIGER